MSLAPGGIVALALLLLLAACTPPAPTPTPAPTRTPTTRPSSTPWPPTVLTPGTHPAPPEGQTTTPHPYPAATSTATPEPYPVETAESLNYQQEEPEADLETIGGVNGIIFPIVWHTTLPRPLGKRGLAWHTTVCTDAVELGVFWYVNWDTRRNNCLESQQPPAYYPTWRPNRTWEWDYRVGPEYDGIAMFLNEPDWEAQDNLTPVEAATLYREFQTTTCPYCKAVVLNLSYNNTTYLIQWREAYRADYGSYPEVFAYGVHSYGYEGEIIYQVESFHNALVSIGEGGKPIYITEWGGCWQGEQSFARQLTPEEMERVLNQFELWDFVEAHAFFGIRWYLPGEEPPEGLHCDALFTPDGITELGQEYAAPLPQGYP